MIYTKLGLMSSERLPIMGGTARSGGGSSPINVAAGAGVGITPGSIGARLNPTTVRTAGGLVAPPVTRPAIKTTLGPANLISIAPPSSGTAWTGVYNTSPPPGQTLVPVAQATAPAASLVPTTPVNLTGVALGPYVQGNGALTTAITPNGVISVDPNAMAAHGAIGATGSGGSGGTVSLDQPSDQSPQAPQGIPWWVWAGGAAVIGLTIIRRKDRK